VLRQHPVLMDMHPDEEQHPLVLAKNVKTFLVEPMDPRKGEWMDAWDQTNQIPALIRVTLVVGSPNEGVYSPRGEDVVSRVITPPSVAVPPNWQTPGGRPQQPAPPDLPLTPQVPGQEPIRRGIQQRQPGPAMR
jgi:hypothetical protein